MARARRRQTRSQRRVVGALTAAVLVLSSVAVAAAVTRTGRRAAARVVAGATGVLPSVSTTTPAEPTTAVPVDTSGVRLHRVDEVMSPVEERPPAEPSTTTSSTTPPGTATATDERVTVQPEQCAPGAATLPAGVDFVASASSAGVRLRSLDGRVGFSLAAAGDRDLRTVDVAWDPAPGGTRVAFVDRRTSPVSSAVIVADVASTCWRSVTPVAAGLYDQPAWRPDGRLGFRSVAGPGVENVSVDVLDPRDEELLVTRVAAPVVSGPVWAPDRTGRFAYADQEGLKVHEPSTGSTRLLYRAVDVQSPAWSPDGSRLAFSSVTDPAVWTVRADAGGGGVGGVGGGARRISPVELAGITRAAWSPDGTRLAFVASVRLGRPGTDVWLMDADGGRVRQLTSVGTAVSGSVTWSPDGSLLAYAEAAAVDGADASVVLVDVGTGDRRVLAPDGRPFAFVRRAGSR